MIKFKNVAGNSFLAVGTIQRKFALNGEKSLSGVIYDGDDVLNNIDKGWSLEFDGEPYVVSYFERNDNDNTLSFDAVHKFFWNMAKSVLYSETSGSHTIKWYLDQIFANTGYSYALNFSPNAIEKENWGMKTKLSLFNDIISSINGEFEINGTLISIFEKVGSDLSTIVRYGFNLSDMSIENDAAGFVTYGEGFGAYEDQQNQSGPRLHATYTSPLASVYGILQAEPVDDQRYTIENNLIQAIKEKVDNSFTVSIKLSLYDLTIAGYPYKMAHVGDWLMAIDEKLDFKKRIRIISIDDEFDANGNRISYTVTAGNIGVVQKYQEANASLSSQVSNALDTANKASDDANIALISANGKNKSYPVDSFDDLPTTANEGDMGWVQSGDGRVLYIYTKKPDGTYYWEKRIDQEMGEQIAAGVDKAVTDAKSYSDQAIETNREQIDAEIKTVSDKTAQLESEQAELDTKAQGYANQALADAKADTQATAQQTAQDAQTALNNAETTLQQEISQKVSQSDYDAKTGDLSLKVSTAQQTADQANTTIGDYKQANDGRVSAAESKIDQNAHDITTKVSQTDYDQKTGELSGEISSVRQTAGEINQTVANVQTQVNGLSVGGRNLVLNSKTPHVGTGTNTNNSMQGNFNYTLANGANTGSLYNSLGVNAPVAISFDWSITGSTISGSFNPQWNGSPWFIDMVAAPKITVSSTNTSGHYSYVGKVTSYWSGTSATNLTLRMDSLQGTLTLTNFKFEQGNMPTAWSPAPEDTAAQISTVSQKVDSITSVVSDPTTGLSKRVQTAEGTLSQVSGVDIPALKSATFWQPYGSLDFNTYTKQGSFFFNTTSAKTNGPTSSTSWIYLKVDQGTSDTSRIKQTAWYDGTAGVKITYVRTLNSGTWSAWYANDNDSVTSISQTNGAIQQEVTNRVTGDTNTLTQAKDFTSSSISNSETGMKSLITQTADGIQAQVDTKTDHDTVLSILKDNWSIGISDNTGELASGVFGDINGMTLNGNTVTINANQTVITGTAFITDAMLTTMSASKLTAGTIDANQINVINLDVSHLTGDVSTFIQTNWNGSYRSTHIDSNGMTINGGSTTTTFDSSGAHFTQGQLNADYSYGVWRDDSNANTSSLGIYLGVRGNTNSFTNIIGPNGGSSVLIAGENMDYGTNNNIVKGYMNVFSGVNIRSRLDFKGSRWNSPTYIEADENRRTLNFYTALGSTGTDGNYFWFSQNVLSNGVFSSASLLSKKNVKSVYEEDALGEIAKTQLVNFDYKNRAGQNHVSPIIDDVNSEKQYYIPKTILGQDGEYVDMYSMISMAWKAIQQLNEKIGEK